ncbi:MAG: excinuclease ABC subunit UvrB [Negativicutes bacterium]|jgi:excinuclease ABC subunit B
MIEQSKKFKVVAPYEPAGDQVTAINELADGITQSLRSQTLLGATGTGKTYAMAKIIESVQKPTLVIAHNKTLAAQLASEFKAFFPENAVEYFVSYYDYYQPEAYMPHTDTFIEKDASINDEIEKMRHSATCSLSERKDVIVVASVSCIYGLGAPEDYYRMVLSMRLGQQIERIEILRKLVLNQYERNDVAFGRGTFRVRGDVVEIFPIYSDERAIRIELTDDIVEHIYEFNYLTGDVCVELMHCAIYPASHYVTSRENLERAVTDIETELEDRLKEFNGQNKLLEAQRLEQRTRYDIEMMREMGFCSGIENYSRHLTARKAGEPPYTLLDYFPEDFLIFVDESHVTLPQIRGMHLGDRSRKNMLVDYGFRLPSAIDNRPLKFEEFDERIKQIVYVSATPSVYERTTSERTAQQIIRPTGLLDPEVIVRPIKGQIDDLLSEINIRVERKERVLVTTLTKKMSEELADYFKELGVKVKYLHSDIVTIERSEIIHGLRAGEFDVLIGINLLREGLDLPEVSLVAILDADKEGFLRSDTSLIQTIGRAARNVNGQVIMYADRITDSMRRAIDETERRRTVQRNHNEKHGITPESISKALRTVLETTVRKVQLPKLRRDSGKKYSKAEIVDIVANLDLEMRVASKALEFERATELRDALFELSELYGLNRKKK